MKKLFFFLLLLFGFNAQSQIVIDNTPPYNTATYLIDNILLGGGIIATNHSFIGNPNQIGFFNGVASNVGIDSGIVLSSGDVFEIVGPNNSAGSFITGNFGLAGDITLDAVIAPTITNDAAVLEFDFVPTSDTISFKYVFGSEEYLEYVATINDAFGFFLSGPNPAGGMYVDENLAIIPVNTPVSIFNVNDVVNSAYYVDNGDGSTAPQNTDPMVIQFDGFTTPLTATAGVNCGDTYHIKLVVADASDNIIDSGVFLESGSFFSPPLGVINDLSIDSTLMEIPCNSTITITADGGVGATYQWFDSTSTVFSTTSSVTVGAGMYVVEADISGCSKFSDTLIVIADEAPAFDLGTDYVIPCNTTTRIDPIVTGGQGIDFYQYFWSTGVNDTFIDVSQGTYILEVDDGTGCTHMDTIVITEDSIPNATISGGGSVCDDGSTAIINFAFSGQLPWDLTYTNGSTPLTISDINVANYSISTLAAGNYAIILADDANDCIADTINLGKVEVILNPLPIAIIRPNDITIYLGEEVELTAGPYVSYEWYTENNFLISNEEIITVQDSGKYKVLVKDENGCADMSEFAIVRSVPLTQIFVPSVFTPNGDEHNELFVIKGLFVKTFSIRIFDRWGEQLFQSKKIDKYWDGTFMNFKVQQGTYYYQIEVLGVDGDLFNKKGNIEVLY